MDVIEPKFVVGEIANLTSSTGVVHTEGVEVTKAEYVDGKRFLVSNTDMEVTDTEESHTGWIYLTDSTGDTWVSEILLRKRPGEELSSWDKSIFTPTSIGENLPA